MSVPFILTLPTSFSQRELSYTPLSGTSTRCTLFFKSALTADRMHIVAVSRNYVHRRTSPCPSTHTQKRLCNILGSWFFFFKFRQCNGHLVFFSERYALNFFVWFTLMQPSERTTRYNEELNIWIFHLEKDLWQSRQRHSLGNFRKLTATARLHKHYMRNVVW